MCSDLQTAGDCTHTRMKIDKLHKDIAEASRRNRKSLIWYSLCMWVGMLLHMIIVCRGAHGKHNHIQIIIRICLTAQVGGFGARHIGLAESYLECAIRAHALACSANIATALFYYCVCMHVSTSLRRLWLSYCARVRHAVCNMCVVPPSDAHPTASHAISRACNDARSNATYVVRASGIELRSAFPFPTCLRHSFIHRMRIIYAAHTSTHKHNRRIVRARARA